MINAFLNLYREVAELKRVIANMVKTGTVAERDEKRGYRVTFGNDENGKSILSPWYPHPENGGDLKTSFPMSVGQTVTTLNPMGDARQGVVLRGGGFSDANPSPSTDLKENKITFGGYTFRLKGDAVEISRDGQSLLFDPNGETTITASKIVLDGLVVMPKGMTAGAGKGVVAVFDGQIHSKQDITSATKISAPILQGYIAKG